MLKKWWNTTKEVLEPWVFYFGVALIIWLCFVLAAACSIDDAQVIDVSGHLTAKANLMYFVIFPIISILWGVWAWILARIGLKFADLMESKEKA